MGAFEVVISAILIFFMISNVWITRIIRGFAVDSDWRYPALNERYYSSTLKTFGNVLLGVLGMNRIFDWHMPPEAALVVLSVAILLHSLPPYIWVWYLKTGRFRDTDPEK